MSKKTIDYLFEDPPISHQKFALISIVGPHMPQKCDIWGLKIRGVAENIEKAKTLTQKLMKIDNNYDIYTVEVGKFFPLVVEPHEVGEIEYENQQLNELVKSYIANREAANEQWHHRKAEMIKDAIREGKNQQELMSKPEHPVAVLQRIKTFQEKIKTLQDDIDSLHQDLQLAKDKFESYSEQERIAASNEVESAINQVINETEGHDSLSLQDIRKQLLGSISNDENSHDHTSVQDPIEMTLKEIQSCEKELYELQQVRSSVNKSESPNVHARITQQIVDIEKTIQELKSKLNVSENVNAFINSNYSHSELNSLADNIGSGSGSGSGSGRI